MKRTDNAEKRGTLKKKNTTNRTLLLLVLSLPVYLVSKSYLQNPQNHANQFLTAGLAVIYETTGIVRVYNLPFYIVNYIAYIVIALLALIAVLNRDYLTKSTIAVCSTLSTACTKTAIKMARRVRERRVVAYPEVSRKEEVLLLCIFSFAAAFLYFYNIGGDMGFRYRVDDGYYSTAARLVHSGADPYKDFVFTHVPLYIYILSAAYSLFGETILTARLVTATIAIFTGLLLYALVRRLYNQPSAILAFVLYLSNPIVLLVDRVTQLSTPVLFFTLLAAYILIASKKPAHVFLSGAVLGVGFLIKESILLSLAGLSLFLLWEKEKKKLMRLLCGFGAGVSPFVYLYYKYPAQITEYIIYHLTRPPASMVERLKTLSYMFTDPVIFLLGLCGLFIAFRRKNTADKLITSLFLTSFLSILGRGFWSHYAPQQIIILAALAGVGAFYVCTKNAYLLDYKPKKMLLLIIVLSLAFTMPKDIRTISEVSDLLPRVAERVSEISDDGEYVLTYYPAIASEAKRPLVGALYEVGNHYTRFTDSQKLIRMSKEKKIKVIVISREFVEEGKLDSFLDFVHVNYREDASFYESRNKLNLTLYVLPEAGYNKPKENETIRNSGDNLPNNHNNTGKTTPVLALKSALPY